ncbi:MAG TPA: MdtA/MuxA family multidrug efflux RND transporter periplasmic adaptor subunit [Stellaceae bacterium]|nr:MdtA/MuxA family multidrug efflux RND transporter periplasmic adaptor subunit [Stellaceae bacterium]
MDELRVDPARKPSEARGKTVAKPHSPLRPVLWTGLVLALIAALAWWIHTRPAPKPPSGRFALSGPMPVVAAPAQKGDIDISYNALGTVTPIATVTVQTQIAGQLVAVAFTEGQEVKAGDFLAQIDPRPYQAALDQYAGQLQRDQAALNEARIDLARYQRLAAQNAIAKQQAEDQEYVVHQGEGTVKLDQALVDNAKLNLGYCRIVAPVDGRIGLRQVDPGNYIQVGSATAIAVITKLKPISVIFTLPEDELPAVMKRLHNGAQLPVTAYDRSNINLLATGTLAAVDSAIDQTTGTVKLRAQFANDDETLFPNQFVNARLLIDTLKDATVIPTAGVQRGQPGTFVYLVKPDDTVAMQKVTLGPQDGERVAISKGLSPDDKVVVDGADKLRDGAKVSLRQESGAGDPTDTAAKTPRQGRGGKPPPGAPASGQPQQAPGPPAGGQ